MFVQKINQWIPVQKLEFLFWHKAAEHITIMVYAQLDFFTF